MIEKHSMSVPTGGIIDVVVENDECLREMVAAIHRELIDEGFPVNIHVAYLDMMPFLEPP